MLEVAKWSAREDLQKIRAWIYPKGDYPYLARKRSVIENYVDSFPDGNLNLQHDSSTGHTGVHYLKSRKRYASYIDRNNSRIELGHYKTPDMAAYAYDLAASILPKSDKCKRRVGLNNAKALLTTDEITFVENKLQKKMPSIFHSSS